MNLPSIKQKAREFIAMQIANGASEKEQVDFIDTLCDTLLDAVEKVAIDACIENCDAFCHGAGGVSEALEEFRNGSKEEIN